MKHSKAYITDRILHWVSSLTLLFLLLNMGAQIHYVDYQVKGQIEHRQDAIELHATVGIMLILLLVTRLLWGKLHANHIPRTSVEKNAHKVFILGTHVLLYLVPIGLLISGLLMVTNIDIPLSIFGVSIDKDMQGFIDIYQVAQTIHLNLITLIWWLIGIHVIGIMYAKR